VLTITDIFIFQSSHTQLTIQGKIGYMCRLEQTFVRPVIRILKNLKLGSRFFGKHSANCTAAPSFYRVIIKLNVLRLMETYVD
jgi:hypothetical protein